MSLYVPGDRIVAAYNIAENHAMNMSVMYGKPHYVEGVFVSSTRLEIQMVTGTPMPVMRPVVEEPTG